MSTTDEANAMKVLNLTPHAVTILSERELAKTYEPSGQVARVEMTRVKIGEIDGAPIYLSRPGEVTGLPAPEPETFYIVSRVVAEAVRRPDLLIPDELVRDEQGRVIAAMSFAVVA